MSKCPTSVIPSTARDLVFSAKYEAEISRLHLEMAVATQSGAGEGNGKVARSLCSLRSEVFSRRPDRLRVAAHEHVSDLAPMSLAVFVDPFEHRSDIGQLVAHSLHLFD
jgi:hypothetical protein